MTTSTTTWRIPKPAWVMVALAVIAESTSNALRAYDLGQHLERFTVNAYGFVLSIAGAVLVLAAVAVSLSQTRCAWVALAPGDAHQRIVSGILAMLLLSISILAMASHILAAQRAKSGDETAGRNGYEASLAAYEQAQAEYAKVQSAPTADEAEAAIAAAAAKVDGVIYRRTKACSVQAPEGSGPKQQGWNREQCEPVTRLAADLARAKRKSALEADLPRLKADLDRQHLTEAASETEAVAAWGWAWIMGLGVVMIATFGPAVFAHVVTIETDRCSVLGGDAKAEGAQNKPEVPLPPTPRKPKTRKRGRKADARVADFSEKFRERHRRAPSGSEIKAEFPDLPTSTAYDYATRSRVTI